MDESLNDSVQDGTVKSPVLERSVSGISASSSCPNLREPPERRNDRVKVENVLPTTLENITTTANLAAEIRNKKATIRQHYYPEGGWGWVIVVAGSSSLILAHGLQLALACMPVWPVPKQGLLQDGRFSSVQQGSLSAISLCVSLVISPVAIAWCRRKSTRLTAVLGGLTSALSLLFTSFASQYHQIALSYGLLLGTGAGLTRDTASLMIGQYFKRKRDAVEIAVVGSSGIGLAIMAVATHSTFNALGWRLGLQVLTVVLFSTFILGSCYRSASLYHPQRRAILHLKNQRKKVKDKNKRCDDRPPFFDFGSLKSRTLHIILLSAFLTAAGLYNPLIYLFHVAEVNATESHGHPWYQVYVGLAWSAGCIVAGLLVVMEPSDCRIGRQYLCQITGLVTGLAVLAQAAATSPNATNPEEQDEVLTKGVLFVFLYGFGLGSYHYTLKVFVYQKVRARNFPRVWGFVQAVQGLGLGCGIISAGYLRTFFDDLVSDYLSGSCIVCGCLAMFLMDARSLWQSRWRSRKHHHRRKKRLSNGVETICLHSSPNASFSRAGGRLTPQVDLEQLAEHDSCPPSYRSRQRRDFLADEQPQLSSAEQNRETAFVLDDVAEMLCEEMAADEVTSISEEAVVVMDIPDHFLEELDFMADCITSCDKVENYLMLSEYENNLSQESSKARKWTLFKQFSRQNGRNVPKTHIRSLHHAPSSQ